MKPTAFNRREPAMVVPNTEPELLTDTGVISPATYKTYWGTTGAATATLADGVCDGHVKVIQMIADVGDAVLTPNSLYNGTTITFADVGDVAVLCWSQDYGAWVMIDAYNMVDGGTFPVKA
jgi:hypothetical protein